MLSNNRCIAECRKFSPNIFNKNKCTGCFKNKEEHNSAALDHNRVSRTRELRTDNKSKIKTVISLCLFVSYHYQL